MSNNNNNWIEAIKNKADQATREVPDGTWQAIAKNLQQQQAPKAKRAIITPRLWKAAAAAAAVAIVATTGFFFINDNDPQPQHIAKEIPQPKPASPVEKPADDSDVPSVSPQHVTPPVPSATIPTTPTLLAKNSPSSTPINKKTHTPRQYNHTKSSNNNDYIAEDEFMNELMANSTNEIIDLADYPNEFNPEDYFYDIETMQALEELYAQYDNAMNQEAMEPWKAYTDSTYQQHLVYDANARKAAREKMALTKHHKQPTMLLAAYGNGLISTDHNSTVNSSTAQLMAPAATNPPMTMAPAAPGVSPRVAPPVNYNYHHHMPLTAGVTFNKRIVKNLYGSVGLNFTSMSSDVTPDNGTPDFKQNIKLIGLPFGVKWNFWKYRGLSTFIGGEGLVERVVSAKFNNESVTIKRLQWSVHATAGAQYNFTRNLGIYVAPKLSHYITTMPLNTIRNEHPLNFNLQFGLSIDF
jgi:hypothetical protein